MDIAITFALILALFTLLGSDGQYDDLVREYRIALARTLN